MERLREFLRSHPRLAQWALLAAAMVLVVLWASWGVQLTPTQRLAIVAATVGLAGLCVWIIHWE
ncbi:MAG: hypothetical protein ACP5UM_06400 [Anaerolineae bacterium]